MRILQITQIKYKTANQLLDESACGCGAMHFCIGFPIQCVGASAWVVFAILSAFLCIKICFAKKNACILLFKNCWLLLKYVFWYWLT